MLNTFFEDKKDLLTIDQFAETIRSTKDEVLDYISKGIIFPLVEIKSGFYVRRIPSLLTEFFSEALDVANRDAYDSLFNNNNIRHSELYKEYYTELKKLSKNFNNNQNGSVLPPVEMMPWESDILITETSFVYAQPDIIVDTQYGQGYLPQYITPYHPRFNIAGIGNEDPYNKFLESDYKIENDRIVINGKTMDIGISNRALSGTENRKPILYFPDVNSIDFPAYKCKQHFPLPIHLAINILHLEDVAYKESGTNYDKLSSLITKKLISILTEKNKINFDMFNDLIILGTLSDRWVRIGSIHDRGERLDNKFALPFNSHSIYINKAQYNVFRDFTGWGSYTLVKFKKSLLDRYKMRNYLIYNKYLYHILKNINDKKYKSQFNTNMISKYLEDCFLDASDDLSNDSFFRANAYLTGTKKPNKDSYFSSSPKNVPSININTKETTDKILNNGKKPATELEPVNTGKTQSFPFIPKSPKKK